MALNTSYKKNYELYKEHLATIKGLKFTFREIDILVCVVHNRGEKKIASLLSISPRTVSVHVYNAMNKLGCNTKDQIIDFMESSGKLPLVREYYVHLLLRASFEKQLTNIGSKMNQSGMTCYCYRNDALSLDSGFYQSIQKHLTMARIKLLEIAPDENNSPIFELKNVSEAGYYRDLLKSLLEVLNPPQKEQIMGEFDEACQTIENIHEGKSAASVNEDHENLNGNNRGNFFLFKNAIFQKKTLTILSVSLFLTLIFFVVGLANFTKFSTTNGDSSKNNTSIAGVPTAVKDLEEFLKAIKDQQFSADNSHPGQIKKNHSLIKKIEKLLEYNALKEVQEYFTKAEMPAEVLTQYLYNLQALASYYLYNMHDGERAEQILLYAKDLAEKYVNIRGKIDNNFNQLNNKEILAELEIVNDLPQIYTRIIYSLARTYIYKKNAINGKKYFELSEYLGNKLGLFEGYLSKISGLLIIEADLADSYIAENKLPLARKILHSIIQSYVTLSLDPKNYIADYKPGETEQQSKTPKKNPYNLFECTVRIIGAYKKLISISKDAKEIESYIAEIHKRLKINEDSAEGLLNILNQVPEKKQANLCNILGELTLMLWQLKTIETIKVTDVSLKQSVITALLDGKVYSGNINLIHDDLALAEKLFTLAREKSRSTDFTKADAYKGLIATYQQMLNHTHGLLESQSHDLKEKISVLLNKLKTVQNNTT